MIQIWTDTKKNKVFDALSPILKSSQGLQIEVSSAFEVLPEAKIVFALGSKALQHAQQLGFVAKNRTVTSLRAVPVFVGTVPLMFSYSADVGDINHGYYIDLLTDFSLVSRFFLTGHMKPQYGVYRYTPDFSELCAAIEKQYEETQSPVDVMMDTETLGLNPYALPEGKFPGAYIVTMQATHRIGVADVVRFSNREEEIERLKSPEISDQLDYLLGSPKIKMKGANFKYDLHWMHVRAKKKCRNFVFDTTIVGSLLDENRSNSLDVHAKIYAPRMGGYSDEFDRTVDKSRMDLVPPATLLPYAAGDVDAGLEVAMNQRAEILQDPQLAGFYVNIMHPAARAFEELEQGGILVDGNAYQELKSDLEAEQLRLVKEASRIIGGRIVAKHYDSTKKGGINLTKAALLSDFLFSQMGLNLKPKMWTAKEDKDGNKKPSTALEHVVMFSDVPEATEFISIFKEYQSVVKTYSTYVVGFLEHLRPDSRFHPTYYLFAGNRDAGEGGTNTGRLSCVDPAFQCLDGASSICTQDATLELRDLVERFEAGEKFNVPTHTGEVKPVTGVYRNGVRPTWKVTTRSGKSLICTTNHPWLTPWGFVRQEHLKVGVPVYAEADSGGRQQDRALGGVSGFGDSEQRASQVPLPMRVRHGEGEVRSESHWEESEHVLWLLQESAAHYAWSQPQRARIQDLLVLAAHDCTLLRSQGQGVRQLWGEGDWRLFFLERILQEFSKRYGGETSRLVFGEVGREWGLRCNQLQVGHGAGASEKPPQLDLDRYWGRFSALKRCGEGAWPSSKHLGDSIEEGVEPDSSPYHASQAQAAGYGLEEIASIEYDGERETFDLTIEDSHSFVANGIVVHNTIPKHTKWAKRIRRCFPAPPGYLVMERDYSQGELRVVACVANETNMIQAYKNGMDLHALTGGGRAGLTYEQMMELKLADKERFAEYRQLAKAMNFGLLYGMGAEGFLDYAIANYKVKNLTLDLAREAREAFFRSYPILLEYHRIYKEFARQYKYVRSPLGRVRHLPMIDSPQREIAAKEERRAINSPIQGCLSDMLLWALSIEHRMGLTSIAPAFGAVHDAAYNYVPEDNALDIAKQHTQVMENLPFEKVGWTPQLNFPADAKLGPNMADMKEV